MVRITIDVPLRAVEGGGEDLSVGVGRETGPEPSNSHTPISARLPAALLAALDESARAAGHTRTAEIIWRLEHSMATVELARQVAITQKKLAHGDTVSAPAPPATNDNCSGSHA